MNPIDVTDDHELDAEIPALVRLLDAERPDHRQALLLEPGERPRLLPRGELVLHLQACGLSSIARRVERVLVPLDHCAALIVADTGVRLLVLPLPTDDDDDDALPRGTVALGALGMAGGR